MRYRVVLEAVAATSLAIGGIAAASAADEPKSTQGSQDGQLSEIVVTATRRKESLTNVPISVSAFKQQTLDMKGIRDINDIARLTPGITVDSNQTNSISIRGISSSGGAGTTGVYVDDTPIQMHALGTSNPADELLKLFDLERVEVLRGPQGTLFGAGSEGGAVRFITPEPSLTKHSVYARTELSYTQGGAPNYEAGIATGGPIIADTLGFRASFWYRRDGGWIDRVNPQTSSVIDSNTNHDDTFVSHLAALWRVSDSVSVNPSLVFQNRERHDLSLYWPTLSNPGSDKYVSADPAALGEPDQIIVPSLRVTANLGNLVLTSVTSYLHRRDLDSTGYDPTLWFIGYTQTLGAPGASPSLTYRDPSFYPLVDVNGEHLPAAVANFTNTGSTLNRQDNWTQELRLQSAYDKDAIVSWTAGLFFSSARTAEGETIHSPQANELYNYLFSDLNGGGICTAFGVFGNDCLPDGNVYELRLRGTDRQSAIYGEATWSLTKKISLITGARYSRTSTAFNAYHTGAIAGPGTSAGNEKANPFTPKVGLEYHLTPGSMAYATYSKGFRVGGANPPIPDTYCAQDFAYFHISGAPATFAPDTVKSWDVGYKADVNGRIQIETSAFYIKWDGIQQNVALPFCGSNYVANLGKAISKGADLQITAIVAPGLTVDMSAGYLNARYSGNTTPGPGAPTLIAANGDAVVGASGVPAPPITATLGAQYDFRIGDRLAFGRVDYSFQARNKWLTAAEDPRTVQFASTQQPGGPVVPLNYNPASQTFVSMRAGIDLGPWEVSAFADNLLDTHVVTNYNTGPLDPNNPALVPLYRNYTFRPRTMGITAILRY